MCSVIVVVGLVSAPLCRAEPPDPAEFAAYLHAEEFGAILQAFVVGLGTGMLVKLLNRS